VPTSTYHYTWLDTLLEEYPEAAQSRQLLIAQNKSSEATTGLLYSYVLSEQGWEVGQKTLIVNFGKTGIAAPGQKREGDGRTPAGAFAIGSAFGYQTDLETNLPFITLNENHFWDSESSSPTYNQLLEERPAGNNYEVMRRQDHLYEYGLVICYNMEPAIPNHGSAIFIHVERRPGSPTLGCISMAREPLRQLIEWLEPEKQPFIVIGREKE